MEEGRDVAGQDDESPLVTLLPEGGWRGLVRAGWAS